MMRILQTREETEAEETRNAIFIVIMIAILLVLLNVVVFGRFKCHRHFFACVQKSRFANFAGRSRRSEYIGFYVANSMFMLDLLLLDSLMYQIADILFTRIFVGPPLLTFMFAFFTFIPSLALIVRRLHDIGVSGWALLIVFVPGLGLLLQLALCFLDSQPGRNAWGPNPKEVVHDGIEDNFIPMTIPMAIPVPPFSANNSSGLVQDSHGSEPDPELGLLAGVRVEDHMQGGMTEK